MGGGFSGARGGFTLLELLVAMTLGFLVLGLAYDLLRWPLAAWQRGYQRAELQHVAQSAMDRLAREVVSSSSKGLNLAGPVLSIQTLDSVTDQGVQVWSPRLILYGWDQTNAQLRRKLWPPGPPTLDLSLGQSLPVPLTADQLSALWSPSNGSEIVLAAAVQDFEVEVRSPLVTAVLKLGEPGRPPLEVRWSRYLPNDAGSGL